MKHLLPILALLTGCSSSVLGSSEEGVYDGAPHTVFLVEGNEHLYIDTIIAADEWNSVCTNIHVTVLDSPSAEGVRVYVDPKLERDYAGIADAETDGTRDIRIQPSLIAMKRVNVIKHEMGHQLGLHHTLGTTGLMAAKVNGDMDVTPALCAMIPEKK